MQSKVAEYQSKTHNEIIEKITEDVHALKIAKKIAY